MKSKNNLIESKIQVPRVSKSFIVRERLIDRLMDREKRLFLLHATVGYGKTVLLTHFRHRYEGSCAWYHLNETDNDLFTFLGYLGKSVEKACGIPAFEPSAYAGLDQDDELLETMAHDFALHLPAAGEGGLPLYLVLDDFQTISNEKVYDAIQIIMADAGERISFCIATKGKVPHFFQRYFLQGVGEVFTQEDFCFDEVETKGVFEEMGLRDLKQEVVRGVCDSVEGWPAGVMFCALNLKQGKGRERLHVTVTYEKSAIRSYFMHEIFRKLPYEIQEFLVVTSVLDFLSADVCNAVMKVDNSQSILDYLVQENLFVIRVGTQGGLFRYHSLFRDFLQEQLKPERKTEILDVAARFYLRSRNREQAVEYAMRGGNRQLAQRAVETVGMEILGQGKLSTMERWMKWLFSQEVSLTPRNRLICGMYRYQKGDAEGALRYLDEATQLFLSTMDENGYFLCTLEKVRIIRSTISPEASNALLDEMLRLVDRKNTGIWRAAMEERIYNDVFLAQYQEALSICSEVILDARKRNSKELEGRYLRFTGVIYFYLGKYRESEKTFHKAEQLLSYGKDGAERFAIGAYEAFTDLIFGRGDQALERIEREIERGEPENWMNEDAWILHLFQGCIMFLAAWQKKPQTDAEAQTVWRDALRTVWIAEKYGSVWGEEHVFFRYLRAVKYSILLKQEGIPSPEQLALDVSELERAHPFARDFALSVLTAFCQKSGRVEEAEKIAHRCLELSSFETIFTSYVRATLVSLLLEQGKRDEAAKQAEILIRYTGQNGLAESLCWHESWPDVQEALNECGDRPVRTLKVVSLGGFEVYMPGERDKVKWRTKKTQELFAYLYHMHGNPVDKESILLMFWPEAGEKQGTSLLHTSLYNIRKILTPCGMKELILYQNGQYSMDMTLVRSDLEEFEVLCQALARGDEEELRAREKSMDLYQGSYLEGIDQEFCMAARTKYEIYYLKLCRYMARRLMNEQQYERANVHIAGAIAVDCYAEEFYRLGIQCYGALGDVRNVRRQYEALCKILKEELDAEPEPETEEAYRRSLGTTTGSVSEEKSAG